MRRKTRETMPASSITTAVLAVGVAVAGVACAAPQQASGPGFAWKDGAEIYAKVCSYCHDSGVGPAIRGSGFDPAVIGFYVRRGSRAMPAFRASEIDDEALAKLGEYLSKN
jgi:mono/diheme cytochrome c family protein